MVWYGVLLRNQNQKRSYQIFGYAYYYYCIIILLLLSYYYRIGIGSRWMDS